MVRQSLEALRPRRLRLHLHVRHHRPRRVERLQRSRERSVRIRNHDTYTRIYTYCKQPCAKYTTAFLVSESIVAQFVPLHTAKNIQIFSKCTNIMKNESLMEFGLNETLFF